MAHQMASKAARASTLSGLDVGSKEDRDLSDKPFRSTCHTDPIQVASVETATTKKNFVAGQFYVQSKTETGTYVHI